MSAVTYSATAAAAAVSALFLVSRASAADPHYNYYDNEYHQQNVWKFELFFGFLKCSEVIRKLRLSLKSSKGYANFPRAHKQLWLSLGTGDFTSDNPFSE